MAQPWEKYQDTSGPWSKYAAPAEQGLPTVAADQIEGTIFGRGLTQPSAGTAEKLADSARYAVGAFFRGDQQSQADMIRKMFPDATIAQDERGRLVARGSDAEPFRYIKTPGVDLEDVGQFAGDVLKFMPAGKAASMGRALLTRMFYGAAASGATSIASDKAAQALGSEQDVDLGKAGLAAAGGAGGEVLSSGTQATMNAVKRSMARRGTSQAGQAFGGMIDDAARQADAATSLAPDDAAREFGIRLTEGQATGRQPQQAFENAAFRGGRGERAQAVMERAFAEQTQQTRNAPVLPGQGVTASNRGFDNADAGRMIRDGLSRRAADLSDEIDEAYNLARSFDASLDVAALPRLRDTMLSAVDDEVINPSVMNDAGRLAQEYPKATAVIEELRGLPERIARRSEEAGGRLTGVQFRELERYRRSLNTAIENAAPRSPDKRALLRMKAAFDGYMDEAVKEGLFSGDPAFIDAFKDARSARQLMGALFEPKNAKDFARKAVQDIIETDASPEEVLNLVFGSSSIGQKRGSVEVVKQLREILGPDSMEYQALREAAVDRVMRKGFIRDEMKIGTLIREWEQALDGPGASTMSEMFSSQELSRMRRFVGVLKRMEPKPGAANTSNTAIEMARLFQGIFGRIPGTSIVQTAIDPSAVRAMQATSGMRPLPRMSAPATATANVLAQTGVGATVQEAGKQQ